MKKANVSKRPEHFENWQIRDDRSYYYKPDYLKGMVDDQEAWKKVLQEHEVLEVLKENYEVSDAGHLGRKKLYQRL